MGSHINQDRSSHVARLQWSGGARMVLRGALPAPLLHGVSRSSGFWDEVFSFGLIVGAVVVLGTLVFLGGRRKRKKGRK